MSDERRPSKSARSDDAVTPETLALLPEQNPNPVVRLASDLTVQYANRSALAFLAGFGLARGAAAPRELADPARYAMLRGQRFRTELSSREHVFSLDLLPGPDGVNVYGYDITDRKRVEAASAHDHEMLSRLFERVPVMITTYAPRLGEFRFNDEFRRVLGWTAEDAAAGDLMALAYPDPALRAEASAYMASLAPGWREFPVNAKDGSVVPSAWANLRLSDDTQVGIGLDLRERKRAEEALRLRTLAARIQNVREAEKSRIARDLHDDLGQILTALRLELRGAEIQAERLAAEEAGPILDRLTDASELASRAIETVQRLTGGLRSEALERLGLDAALRQELRDFARRTGVEVSEAVQAVPTLERPLAMAAFRIAQEALTNVARHAAARRVTVRLAATPTDIRLDIADDGRGLPPAGTRPESLGILGMMERAREFGGEVSVAAGDGGGTVVSAVLPRVRGGSRANRRP